MFQKTAMYSKDLVSDPAMEEGAAWCCLARSPGSIAVLGGRIVDELGHRSDEEVLSSHVQSAD